jgi:hypothetical protein
VQHTNLDVAVSGTSWAFLDAFFAFVANVSIDAVPAADALNSFQRASQFTGRTLYAEFGVSDML